MAIHAPGKRDRHNRRIRGGKRSVVAMLSLTAMVDMFTVLAVFLLQNYQTTGAAIEISDDVALPQASAVKELRPAHVVVVSKDSITLDKDFIATYAQVKELQGDWKINNLYNQLIDRFRAGEERLKASPLGQFRDAVDQTKSDTQRINPDDLRRVTIQADKSIDFLTIKKVMYTLYEAGSSEINFAVIKEDK